MISIKKIAMASLAVLTIVGATAASTTDAEARYRGGGYRGGYGGGYRGGYYGGYHGYRGYGVGAGFATGLAIGAVGAGYGYGYGPGYGYGYGGCVRNQVVGYTAYGHPIVRPVNVCY